MGLSWAGLLASVVLLTACGDDPTYLEDIPGYEDAKSEAEFYCTLGGVVGPNGPDSLYDPAYLECVEQETRKTLVQAGHDEAESAPLKQDS